VTFYFDIVPAEADERRAMIEFLFGVGGMA